MMKTALLLAAMTALFMATGYALGGNQGMIIAFAFACITNVASYWFSDRIVLSMYHARPIRPEDNPRLYSLIARLAAKAGIPMPKAYLLDNPQPNAFATGRNPAHGAVAVTSGLLSMLDERELAAVIAHELGHIKNRDTLIMTVTATLAGAIGMLGNLFMFTGGGRQEHGRGNALFSLALMILAPLAAMLVQFAISRTREYGADRSGAEFTEDPLALASALRKISMAAGRIVNPDAEQNPATAHLFIMNPLHLGGVDNLFSTHPAPEKRIAALEAMASRFQAPVPIAEESPRLRRGSFNF